MSGHNYQQNTATILATPSDRVQLPENLNTESAERAIRSARRQVQRNGDKAREALLSWCKTDEEREWLLRAIGTARVGTIVQEWDERTQEKEEQLPS